VDKAALIEDVRQALYCSKICSYAQVRRWWWCGGGGGGAAVVGPVGLGALWDRGGGCRPATLGPASVETELSFTHGVQPPLHRPPPPPRA